MGQSQKCPSAWLHRTSPSGGTVPVAPSGGSVWSERAVLTSIQIVMRNINSYKNAVYISKALGPRLTHLKRVLKNASLMGRESDQRQRLLKWRPTGSGRGRCVLSKGLQGALNQYRNRNPRCKYLSSRTRRAGPLLKQHGCFDARSALCSQDPVLNTPGASLPLTATFYASSKFYFLLFDKLHKLLKWNFAFTVLRQASRRYALRSYASVRKGSASGWSLTGSPRERSFFMFTMFTKMMSHSLLLKRLSSG